MNNKVSVYSFSDRAILIVDEILTVAFSYIMIDYYTSFHAAICLAISLVIAGVLFAFFLTRIGFWIISIIFSLIWTALTYKIVEWLSKSDKTWMIVASIFAFIVFMSLHTYAKRFEDNVEY